jgi:hypothetical protein
MTEDKKNDGFSRCFEPLARLNITLCKGILLAVFCLLSSVLYTTAASAEGIAVNKAEIRQSEDGYQLSAHYDVNLTLAVQEALTRGIPLYFVSEFSVTRSRWYWLDEEVFQGEQTVKLSYNVLTRQYRISRGALFQNFANFEDAINMLSRQNSASIPAELMKKEGNYLAAARLRLDIAQLPKLLQVNAVSSKDWSLSSDWYRWIVRPTEISTRNESKAE